MISWYVAIKLTEWVIWSGIGGYYVRRSLKTGPTHWVYPALAGAFFFFGLADFVEYFTNGTFPWWLWAWKIGGGLLLFGLLVTEDYFKRGAVALAPWRFLAAGFILAIALACIVVTGGKP